MGVTFVRSTNNRVSTGSVSSMTLSISASAGQMVLVQGFPSGGSSSTPVSSITDNGGNSWGYPGSYSSNLAEYTGGSGAFVGYCNVSHNLSSVTVNIPTASELTVCVSVYNGAKTSLPVRQSTTGTSTSLSLNVLGGGLTLGTSNTSSGTSISGLATLTTNHGNLAGYGTPGPNETQTFSWSPSQNAPAVFTEFLQGSTVMTIYGTATVSDPESLTANVNLGAISTLMEIDLLTANPGANPHVAFSAITPDQTDANGIPLIHGLTTYNYLSAPATQYDHWMSLQDGQLAAGLYNASRNSGLTVASSVPTWTDSGSRTLGMVRSYSADSTADLTNFGAETDVTGATVSVVVTGSNATVIVTGDFTFVDANTAQPIEFIGYLNWNGVDQLQQVIFEGNFNGAIASVARTWRITGVTAGTYVAKLRAFCSTASVNNKVAHPNTGITALLIDQ
jgi:hypothetical protein